TAKSTHQTCRVTCDGKTRGSLSAVPARFSRRRDMGKWTPTDTARDGERATIARSVRSKTKHVTEARVADASRRSNPDSPSLKSLLRHRVCTPLHDVHMHDFTLRSFRDARCFALERGLDLLRQRLADHRAWARGGRATRTGLAHADVVRRL